MGVGRVSYIKGLKCDGCGKEFKEESMQYYGQIQVSRKPESADSENRLDFWNKNYHACSQKCEQPAVKAIFNGIFEEAGNG